MELKEFINKIGGIKMFLTIDKLFVNQRRDGKGEFRTVVTPDGQRYSCFQTSLFPFLEVGKQIDATIEQNNQYLNIVGCVPVVQVESNGARTPIDTTAQLPEPTIPPENDRNVAIMRQTAVKCASTIVASDESIQIVPTNEQIGEEVIRLAKRFMGYFQTGE